MSACENSEPLALFDAAEFIDSEEDAVAYLNAALEDGDPATISTALGDIARAYGMTQLAKPDRS